MTYFSSLVALTTAVTLASGAFAETALPKGNVFSGPTNMRVAGTSNYVITHRTATGAILGVSGVVYANPAVDTSGGFTRNDIHRMNDSYDFRPTIVDPDGVPSSGDEYST